MARFRGSLSTVLGAAISPVLFVSLVLATAAACRSGDRQAIDDTAGQVSSEELSRMVLSAEQFGLEFQGFTADADNGPLTLDQTAGDNIDPINERNDLERFRWTAGQRAFYSRPQAATAAPGVFTLGSEISLFATSDRATDYLAHQAGEIGDDTGKTNNGVTLTKEELFEAKLADEARGVRVEARLLLEDPNPNDNVPPPTFDYWGAGVRFRHGRIIASVSLFGSGLSAVDKDRLEARVQDLARKLNEQMTAVLAGAATATSGS